MVKDQTTSDVETVAKDIEHRGFPSVGELLHRVNQEREYWRDAAAYLASCHAATAEGEGLMKKTSKLSRSRFVGICKTCVEILNRGWHAKYNHFNVNHVSDAKERCQRVLETLEKNFL